MPPGTSEPPSATDMPPGMSPLRVLAVVPARRRPALEAALAGALVSPVELRWHEDTAGALADDGGDPSSVVMLMAVDDPADAAAHLSDSELRRLDAILPVVVLLPQDPPADQRDLLEHLVGSGLQDVLVPDDLGPRLGPRLRLAVCRRERALVERGVHATDAATGLPIRQQLVDHMNHLIALREREPAPMGVLVVRLERLNSRELSVGDAVQQSLLRRKIAVRLRGVLRASDVVASLEPDQFGVLLSAVDRAEDADGVAAKLLAAVQRPFSLGGQPHAVAGAVGCRVFPRDGADAALLLDAAARVARSQPAVARGGLGAWQTGGVVPPAANDE